MASCPSPIRQQLRPLKRVTPPSGIGLQAAPEIQRTLGSRTAVSITNTGGRGGGAGGRRGGHRRRHRQRHPVRHHLRHRQRLRQQPAQRHRHPRCAGPPQVQGCRCALHPQTLYHAPCSHGDCCCRVWHTLDLFWATVTSETRPTARRRRWLLSFAGGRCMRGQATHKYQDQQPAMRASTRRAGRLEPHHQSDPRGACEDPHCRVLDLEGSIYVSYSYILFVLI